MLPLGKLAEIAVFYFFIPVIGSVSMSSFPTPTTPGYGSVPGPGIVTGPVQKKAETNGDPTRCFASSSTGQTASISAPVLLYRD